MNEKKTFWIILIVLSGFVALSYAGGFHLYMNLSERVGNVDSQDKVMGRDIRRLRDEVRQFSAAVNDIDNQLARSVRDLAFLENKVNAGEDGREAILSQMQSISDEIAYLRNTYTDYVSKLDEMGTILQRGENASAQSSGEFVKDVDLGEIAVEQEGYYGDFQPADFYEQDQ